MKFAPSCLKGFFSQNDVVMMCVQESEEVTSRHLRQSINDGAERETQAQKYTNDVLDELLSQSVNAHTLFTKTSSL